MGNILVASPFLALGGFFLVAFDSEHSVTTSRSEAQNSLLGLGLLAGGKVLWGIGNSIEEKVNT